MEVKPLTKNRKREETSGSLGMNISLVLSILRLKCLEAIRAEMFNSLKKCGSGGHMSGLCR